MIKSIYLSIVTLLLFFLFSGFQSLSNFSKTYNEEPIRLIWKLEKNDTLSYKTIMAEVGKSSFTMDLSKFFEGIGDSLPNAGKEWQKEFIEDVREIHTKTNFITHLTNSPDFSNVIDITMVAIPKTPLKENDTQNQFGKMMQTMMKGAMLRGSVHKTGGLHSFWVKSGQKNLISMLFELPEDSIKVGDKWTLNNINFIGNDQNFTCRIARKRNMAQLTDVKISNNETIAVINYDLYEHVEGDFNSPMFKETKQSKTTFIFKGQAEFSIEQGKWLSYNGILSVESTGVFQTKQVQKFALMEE